MGEQWCRICSSLSCQIIKRGKSTTKFIFLDFISAENIQTLTDNIGFKDDEVIWLYQYFSDIPIVPTTYTVDDLKKDLGNPVTAQTITGKTMRLYIGNDKSYVVLFKE